ncbi:MAG: metal ABC transporter ATP-binding protein [Muribaculaceae bacterium]|nr:metal ABC transporter ATP-binding protein [Muribaculaceae bacterium]
MPLIELSNINMSWGHQKVLSDVNLTVNRGDFIAVTGPNGGGKTTLLRLILKLISPVTGKVRYFNNDTEVKSLPIGYLPQKNMIDSHFPITLSEVIASGLLSSHLSSEDVKRKVRETLATINLEEHANRPIGQLSGGQLQRGLLGRAIISHPEILVLDEPLSYIDKHFEKKIYEIISQFAEHTTIILVSHEMSTIASMANRHIIVDHTIHDCTARHHFITTECDD